MMSYQCRRPCAAKAAAAAAAAICAPHPRCLTAASLAATSVLAAHQAKQVDPS